MNKWQITEGENSLDKIEEKRRGNIPRLINLRFWIRTLPLNSKVWRKANRTYRADELCFYQPSLKRKFSRSWFLPESFNVSFFLFNKRIMLFQSCWPKHGSSESSFVVEVLYMAKALYLRGKACQLAVLNFNNSPITHLVALKCGSARELVISTNHSPRVCPALTRGFGGNEPSKPMGHISA